MLVKPGAWAMSGNRGLDEGKDHSTIPEEIAFGFSNLLWIQSIFVYALDRRCVSVRNNPFFLSRGSLDSPGLSTTQTIHIIWHLYTASGRAGEMTQAEVVAVDNIQLFISFT